MVIKECGELRATHWASDFYFVTGFCRSHASSDPAALTWPEISRDISRVYSFSECPQRQMG